MYFSMTLERLRQIREQRAKVSSLASLTTGQYLARLKKSVFYSPM